MMPRSQGVCELMNSVYLICVVLQYVCIVIIFLRWCWHKKHVRYIYPTMHLPLCLFVTCTSLYSIFLLFPFWVRQYSACNFHTLSRVSVYFFPFIDVFCSLFTCILCFFVALFQFHIFFVSCLDKSSSGSFPQRYIACVWLHVSDAFWLFEPPAPHCFSVCSTADTPLSIPSLSTCILAVLLISY